MQFLDFCLEQTTAGNVNFPGEPFHLLIVHHGVGVHQAYGSYPFEVLGGTSQFVKILVLAHDLVEQGLTKGDHDFRLDKGNFLGQHFLEGRVQ